MGMERKTGKETTGWKRSTEYEECGVVNDKLHGPGSKDHPLPLPIFSNKNYWT